MEVAFVNPQKPVTNYHMCNVCNFHFIWNDESGYYEKCVGEGYAAYEVQFKICSNECRKKATEEKMIDNFYK